MKGRETATHGHTHIRETETHTATHTHTFHTERCFLLINTSSLTSLTLKDNINETLRAEDESTNNSFLYAEEGEDRQPQLKLGRSINACKDDQGVFSVTTYMCHEGKGEDFFQFTNLKFTMSIAADGEVVTLMKPLEHWPVSQCPIDPRVFKKIFVSRGAIKLQPIGREGQYIDANGQGGLTVTRRGMPFKEFSSCDPRSLAVSSIMATCSSSFVQATFP